MRGGVGWGGVGVLGGLHTWMENVEICSVVCVLFDLSNILSKVSRASTAEHERNTKVFVDNEETHTKIAFRPNSIMSFSVSLITNIVCLASGGKVH